MGQVLHGGAKTTHALRAAIQRSKATIAELAERYDLNPKTLPRVATEMALHVLAYNMTRVMNIIGIKPLMAAIRA